MAHKRIDNRQTGKQQTRGNVSVAISLSQEQELQLIWEGCSYDHVKYVWTATYPFLVSKDSLPYNYVAASAILRRLEWSRMEESVLSTNSGHDRSWIGSPSWKLHNSSRGGQSKIQNNVLECVLTPVRSFMVLGEHLYPRTHVWPKALMRTSTIYWVYWKRTQQLIWKMHNCSIIAGLVHLFLWRSNAS